MDARKSDGVQGQMSGARPDDLGEVATDQPVLPVPFTAEIDGRQCRGEGVSLVRAEVAGLLDPALEGQERLVRLSFAFQGFTVALAVRSRIGRVDGGRADLVFTDPTGDHLPQLRHLLNGWIAGDLVSLGQILGVTTSPAKAGRAGGGEAAPAGRLAARLLGSTLMLAAAAALVGATMVLVYARGFTQVLPGPARIAPEGQTLAALASGQIDYLNPEAAPGEVAFTLRALDGQVLAVAMPCDCEVVLQGLAVGATVQAGDPVMSVHPLGAALVATAPVPAEMLLDLARAEAVALTLPDGTRLPASPELPLPAAGAEGNGLVTVTFRLLSQPTGLTDGTLAEVGLSLPVPQILLPARALYHAIGG